MQIASADAYWSLSCSVDEMGIVLYNALRGFRRAVLRNILHNALGSGPNSVLKGIK